jgi:hypothetical protein
VRLPQKLPPLECKLLPIVSQLVNLILARNACGGTSGTTKAYTERKLQGAGGIRFRK